MNYVSLRMGRVSAVFGNVRERLWNNRHMSIRVKCKVYRVTVVATLLGSLSKHDGDGSENVI